MGNFPSEQLNRLSGQDFVGETVSNLMELHSLGIPKDTEELKDRIDKYFMFCKERNFRPGIESLALALGTNRQNFWKWCNGNGGKQKEWQDVCCQAKQVVLAFLESAGLSGKLNPATLIFSLKNQGWNYTDNQTVEFLNVEDKTKYIKASELPKLGGGNDEKAELPKLK